MLNRCESSHICNNKKPNVSTAGVWWKHCSHWVENDSVLLCKATLSNYLYTMIYSLFNFIRCADFLYLYCACFFICKCHTMFMSWLKNNNHVFVSSIYINKKYFIVNKWCSKSFVFPQLSCHDLLIWFCILITNS